MRADITPFCRTDSEILDAAKQWRDEFLKQHPCDARHEGKGEGGQKHFTKKRHSVTERAHEHNAQKSLAPMVAMGFRA